MKLLTLDSLKYIMNYLKTQFNAPSASNDDTGNRIADTYLRKDEKASSSVFADTATTARSVDWENVQGRPNPVELKNDALGIGAKVDFNFSGMHEFLELGKDGFFFTKPVTADLHGKADTAGTADVANAVSWDNVKGRPEKFVSTWSDLEGKPATFLSTWDTVQGKPETYPPAPHVHDDLYVKKTDLPKTAEAANTMNVYKTLGSETTKYIMSFTDFDKIGIYHIVNLDIPVVCDNQSSNEMYAFNMSADNARNTVLLGMTTQLNAFYIGKFADGVWQGWQLVATKSALGEQEKIKVTKSMSIPTSDDGTGNIWIS